MAGGLLAWQQGRGFRHNSWATSVQMTGVTYQAISGRVRRVNRALADLGHDADCAVDRRRRDDGLYDADLWISEWR